MRDSLALTAADEAEMVALGASLAALLPSGLVVFLEGDLGMGKTTLARGIIQALGQRGAVKSPTYTLVEPYQLGERLVYHFDLYRLGDPEELEFMGIRDYFSADSLCLVEWAERGKGFLPPADLVINIEQQDEGRRLELFGDTVAGEVVVEKLRSGT
tara:strand:- start:45940 stop:46410 length:471 start_codon:yes stop_codon:yes gene_type:complete